MNKIYLIDSENVNDAWVDLLPVLECGERIIVFYTDKSPHMCYQNVIALLQNEREIQFIKCFEGNNALDFQLVSELGYMLCDMPECEYIIVSNDTGFDAIVKYWKKRGKTVSRVKGKECRVIAAKCKEANFPEAVSDISQKAEEMASWEREGEWTLAESPKGEETEDEEAWDKERNGALEDDTEENDASMPDGTEALMEILEKNGSENPAEDAVCVMNILKVVTLRKMALFHNALTCMFEQKLGDELYSYIKEHRNFYMTCRGTYISKKKERERYYISLILERNGLPGEAAPELHKLLYSVPKKDLKSLNNAILKEYGRTQGAMYYAVLKKHLKVIGKL